jgi:cysteine-rich repeat protein
MGAFESACGDGTVDADEQCDDGNVVDDDGCQHNCRLPSCGDAILDPSEECDDGGSAESCCSAGCTLAAAGAPCSSPGDLCTADVCDAVGQCWPTCGPCFTCEPTVGCVLPANSCDGAAPASSQITIKDQDKDTADATTWRWKGTGVTTKADFGNPTAGGAGYELCVYDDAGGASVLADIGAGCDQAFCWTETPRAFKLKSGTATQGKVTAVLTAGTPGKMLIKTRGSAEGVPALPLTTPVEVRFIRKDGGCWGASYGTAVKKNSAQVFSAKSD